MDCHAELVSASIRNLNTHNNFISDKEVTFTIKENNYLNELF